MKKFIAIFLTLMLALPTMAFTVGCGSGTEIDDTKTQIIVGLDQSGYGRNWMDDLIKDFEAAYADEVFEEGKKGVQVTLRFKPNAYASDTIHANIAFAEEDIYVVNRLYYFDFVDKATGESTLLADLSDILTEGGENSIYNRMNKTKRDYLNVGTESEPKIYACSWVEGTWGMYYDKDLFQTKGFYTLDGYKGLDCIEGNDDDLWGPDGKEGTVDDGMPATFEDFKVLVNTMVENEVTPFTWTGAYAAYRGEFLNTVLASYEGADNFKQRYEWNGEGDDRFNAYKYAEQQGVKAMLEFAKFITSKDKFYSTKVLGNTTHLDAQKEFVYAGNRYSDSNPIGFLIEGGWFEQEAASDIANRKRLGFTANFGVMPVPKFIGSKDTHGIDDQTNTKTTFAGTPGTSVGAVLVNKAAENLDAAKAFVKYFLSEEQNAKFTTRTNLIQPYDYELTAEQKASISTLCAQRYEYKNSPYAEDSSFVISNEYFIEEQNYFGSWYLLNLDNKTDPIKAFIGDKTMTVEDYLKAYKDKYNSETWPYKAS